MQTQKSSWYDWDLKPGLSKLKNYKTFFGISIMNASINYNCEI